MSTHSTPELIEPVAQDLAEFERLFEHTSAIGATPGGGCIDWRPRPKTVGFATCFVTGSKRMILKCASMPSATCLAL